MDVFSIIKGIGLGLVLVAFAIAMVNGAFILIEEYRKGREND